MSGAREYRIARMQEMGLSRADAETVDSAAKLGAAAALEAGMKVSTAVPARLATLATAAFLGELAGEIMALRGGFDTINRGERPNG